MLIEIITTGGTIDKIYFDANSRFEVGEPQIGDVLKEANLTLEYRIVPLLRKDSLDLTEADREVIKKTVLASPSEKIVITHGTDTMVQTAQSLQNLGCKTIVLTGAMQPARFRSTDAIYNVASALTAVQVLPQGVWIVMNGKIFSSENVRKNTQLNCFEEISSFPLS